MEMIKACMPKTEFGTLYKMNDLAEVINYLKDSFAITPAKRTKKATQANASATGASPFTAIKGQPQPDLAQHLNKLTETLNKIDFKQKPYKPQNLSQRKRARPRKEASPKEEIRAKDKDIREAEEVISPVVDIEEGSVEASLTRALPREIPG